MKKVVTIFISFVLLFGASLCYAEQQKKVIHRIDNWREDTSCGGMELGKFIVKNKDANVSVLIDCCKRHSSACLETYSTPENKTLLYIAIEAKAYKVIDFLFAAYPQNYFQAIDNYGITEDYYREMPKFFVKEVRGKKTSKTPLMLACSNGDLEGTKTLIKYGANLRKKNYDKNGKENKSAYDYAKTAQHKDFGFMDFVESEYKKQSSRSYGENNIKDFNPLESLDITQNQI